MDIDDIRRTNIRTLEKQAGSITTAAEQVGMTYAQFLNYRNGAKESKTGKIRGMRKETAQRFEDAFGKPRGWLDTNHDSDHKLESLPGAYVVKKNHDRKLVQTVCELAEQISDDGLRELIGFARCLTGTQPLVKQTAQVICMTEWRQRMLFARDALFN